MNSEAQTVEYLLQQALNQRKKTDKKKKDS
jgi:hypothetical protein